MTITEIQNEIAKRRKFLEEKIAEIKKEDEAFQKWMLEAVGINERTPLAPETILTVIEKFMPKDK